MTTSAAYAPGRPTVARSRPPIAGPTTDAAWKLSWFRAIAAGRWAGLTSRGIAAERVGPSTELRPAAMKATPKIAARGGPGMSARTTRLRLVRAIPTWVTISTLRRSTASASEPAPSEKTRIGTSWASTSAPIASVEPVRT